MNSNSKTLMAIALLGAASVFSSPAEAAFRCSIASGVGLNFGNYDDVSPISRDVSATFSVSCCSSSGPRPEAGTISIAFGASTNSGQINTRQMRNSLNPDLMSYQLYFGSFGGTVWGNGVSGGSVFTQNVSINTRCSQGGGRGSCRVGNLRSHFPAAGGVCRQLLRHPNYHRHTLSRF